MTRDEQELIWRSLRFSERTKDTRLISLTRQLERRAQVARAMDSVEHSPREKAIALAKHNLGITSPVDSVDEVAPIPVNDARPRRKHKDAEDRRRRRAQLLDRIVSLIEEACDAEAKRARATDTPESPLGHSEWRANESRRLA